jgi:hypothetical protein
LYVYVGNNPLEYIDPTGHVKETPEQETTWVLSLPEMMAVPP